MGERGDKGEQGPAGRDGPPGDKGDMGLEVYLFYSISNLLNSVSKIK